jgi:hypothetical protein
MLIIMSVVVYAVNPYGIIQILQEYAEWLYHQVWEFFFENHPTPYNEQPFFGGEDILPLEESSTLLL